MVENCLKGVISGQIFLAEEYFSQISQIFQGLRLKGLRKKGFRLKEFRLLAWVCG